MQESVQTRFEASLIDQVQYVFHSIYEDQIHIVISVERRIDEGRLKKALRMALDAEPVLGSKFVEHDRHPFFEQREDLDQLELCSLVEADDIEEVLLDYVNTPIDPRRDALIHVLVIRSTSDTIVIKTNHVVMDAGGLLEFVDLLFNIYRKLNEDSGYKPAINLSEERGLEQIFDQFNSMEKLKSFSRTVAGDSQRSDRWNFAQRKRSASDRAFSVRKIGIEQLRAIKEYGREHNVTVNDIMGTAFFRALAELFKPDSAVKLQVDITVDMRQYLPSGRAGMVCNLSSYMRPKIMLDPDDPFKVTIAQINKTTNQLKASNTGMGFWLRVNLISGIGFRNFRHLMEREFKKKDASPMISNIGVLHRERIDFGDTKVLDAFILGPFMYPPYPMLVVSTFEDVMTLTMSYCEANENRPVVERLLDKIIREIEDACPTH